MTSADDPGNSAGKRRRGRPQAESFFTPPTPSERAAADEMLARWRDAAERYGAAHKAYRKVEHELATATADAAARERLELQAAVALEFIDTVDIALGRQPLPVAMEDPQAAIPRVAEERAAPRAVAALEEMLQEFKAASWKVERLSPAMKWQACVALCPWNIGADEDEERALNAALDDVLTSYELEDQLLKLGPHKAACWLLAEVRGQDIRTVQENLRKARNIAKRFANTPELD